jgi:branched-chain amino acid transport system substrate-binding protein
MLLVQFQNIKSNSLDEFRDLSTEVILDPPQYKSGNLIYPYGEAKK